MWYSTFDELLSEFHQYNYFILEAIWHKFVPAVVNFNEENYNWFKKCLGANMAMSIFQDSSAYIRSKYSRNGLELNATRYFLNYYWQITLKTP